MAPVSVPSSFRLYDRRRWRRVRLSVPVRFGKGAREKGEVTCAYVGQSRDLSTGGLYLTTREKGMFVPDDTLTVSVAIPWEARRHFPFSRILGSCRVVRIEELTTPKQGKQFGAALEFCGDIVTLLGAM